MGFRRLGLGRDAHQALGSQAKVPAQGDEGVRPARRDPGLARLLASVDLHIEARRPAGAGHLGGQGVGQPLAVYGLDHVEKRHGVTRLVGLQRPDQPKLDARSPGLPATLGLLHPVFAESPLSGGQHGLDPVIGLLLGHGDQSHIVRRATGVPGRGGDAIQDDEAGSGDIG